MGTLRPAVPSRIPDPMPPFTLEDAHFMARALKLAELGLNTTHPNPRVGCVLVQNGRIVGEGWHRRTGGPHAEVEALRMAGESARGATAYVTLEPCCHHGKTPPCSAALLAAGVTRVVAAMTDPNPKVAGGGLEQLRAAGIEIASGLLESEAEALNRGFLKRMRIGRPYVTSKLAMSLDGRTAMASGESQWITGPEARRDVHKLRARSSAILTGVDTVLTDNPALTVRLDGEIIERQPHRIVLDTHLRTPVSAKILAPPDSALILTCAESQQTDALRAAGAGIYVLPPGPDGRVDPRAALDLLGRLECNELMVEAGATLNGALLAAGLVDEWWVYLAPCVLGDEGRGLFRLPGLERMADRYELTLVDSRQVGRDLRLRFLPRRV